MAVKASTLNAGQSIIPVGLKQRAELVGKLADTVLFSTLKIGSWIEGSIPVSEEVLLQNRATRKLL